MDISKVFPITTLTQGDDVHFHLWLVHMDSAFFTVTYVFNKSGVPNFSFSSTPSPDGSYVMTVPAATTANWIPGSYYVTAQSVEIATGLKTTLGTTEMIIKADPTVEGYDPRSQNRRALDDVEAALASGAGSDVKEYEINGTKVTKDRPQLLALRAYYLQRVRNEDGKKAIGNVLYNL